MIRVRRADGALQLETDAYHLALDEVGPRATLSDAHRGAATQLMLLASLDTDRGLDGTLGGEPLRVEETADAVTVSFDAPSTVWDAKRVVLRCTADEVAVQASVSGRGRLTDARLLGGWYNGSPRWGSGLYHSRWPARTLFVPSPDHPQRLLQPASEPATVGVNGGDMPGRGHWFFTPGPFLFAGSEADVDDPGDSAAEPWQLLELRCAIDEATFSEMRYAPFLGGFSVVLAYEGQTVVDGQFSTPPLVLRPGAADPYRAIADHAGRLRSAGLAPAIQRQPADWWLRPIFCGWGEQYRQFLLAGGHPTAWSRQEHYDRWLDHLAERDIVPGTVVVDDKWQKTYGRNDVDTERWPDMGRWIAERHAAGQRVLLWFKAWDAEGLPDEACLKDPGGHRLVADPESPAYGEILREALAQMLGRGGLDADGLKVDFTAQTPSGPGFAGTGSAWGVALLHRLLTLIYRYAKEAKADALVVTHTPNPLFADVTDMIRLNDLMRLSQPDPLPAAVPQMTHRARIARAVDPDLLIDTDDWCMPSRAEWRAYLEAKVELGVPALYYATGIDYSREPFGQDDYAAIRAAWARYEAGRAGARVEAGAGSEAGA